jgi:hypothetical protein
LEIVEVVPSLEVAVHCSRRLSLLDDYAYKWKNRREITMLPRFHREYLKEPVRKGVEAQVLVVEGCWSTGMME